MSTRILSTRTKLTAATVSALLLTTGISTAHAAGQNGWDFELTPYIWATGIEADVEAADRKAEVDASASDLAENLDMTGSVLATAHYNSWAFRAQVDYFELSSDLRNSNGTIETTNTMSTFGFGYQFRGFVDNQTIDVLIGVRNLVLDNELKINNVGTFSSDRDVTDPIIMIQPDFQLSEKWRFNPMFSYGAGGDSEYTYELQPQFQYQAWEQASIRFGYRKVHYKIESDNGGKAFDGDFAGPFIGFGFTFGN